MSTVLFRNSGEYFGKIHHAVSIDSGVLLVDSSIRPGTRLPSHSHESAYLNFVLKGGFEESVGSRNLELKANTLTFHPAEECHRQSIRDAEVRWLNIELSRRFLDRLPQALRQLPLTHVVSPRTAMIAGRIASEIAHTDELSQLVLEGLVFELCGCFLRESRKRDRGSRSLAYCAKEIIDSRIGESLGLKDLADTLDTNESRLAAEFRASFNQTVGDYVRIRRIAQAATLISDTDRSLAMIALELGFFDQSHFTRSFKRVMGFSPSEFRKRLICK